MSDINNCWFPKKESKPHQSQATREHAKWKESEPEVVPGDKCNRKIFPEEHTSCLKAARIDFDC
jgi:hypothetical protein